MSKFKEGLVHSIRNNILRIAISKPNAMYAVLRYDKSWSALMRIIRIRAIEWLLPIRMASPRTCPNEFAWIRKTAGYSGSE